MCLKQNLEQVISVIFFGFWQSSNLLKTATLISNSFEQVFEGDPFMLPVMEDAPPEIPRLTFKNKDESIILQISGVKATLLVRGKVEEKLQMATELTDKLLSIILEEFKWGVNRLGRVYKSNIDLSSSSISFIKKQYLSSSILDDIAEINLNWRKEVRWKDDIINHWNKIKAKNTDIEVIYDINLVNNSERELNLELSKMFFQKSLELKETSQEQIFK